VRPRCLAALPRATPCAPRSARSRPPSPSSALPLEQVEKSYQKQPTVFLGYKKLAKSGTGKLPRWYRKVGLGFATPKEASRGVYVDKKCPFTGDVSIRGRILKGVVISTKMTRTIVIRRDYLCFVKKYRRYEKRHKTLSAHCSPAFLVKDGDVVTVGECRPLSKTVRFNVLKVESATEAGAMRAKKTFRVF
jgi:small subunit ribosomal protein S11e